jgi:hypothetical protein
MSSLMPRWILCARMLLALLVAPPGFAAHAAELDGMQLPEIVQQDGRTLYLNGYGLRTYSLLGLHIYVAALYLEHYSDNPAEILHSPEIKLLTIMFERNVAADTARRAWREGLDNNCEAPCHLDPAAVDQFLAAIPAMHTGDNYSILITSRGATVTVSGRPIGIIPHPQLAEAMLATFLGPRPASARLKQELLRGHP